MVSDFRDLHVSGGNFLQIDSYTDVGAASSSLWIFILRPDSCHTGSGDRQVCWPFTLASESHQLSLLFRTNCAFIFLQPNLNLTCLSCTWIPTVTMHPLFAGRIHLLSLMKVNERHSNIPADSDPVTACYGHPSCHLNKHNAPVDIKHFMEPSHPCH